MHLFHEDLARENSTTRHVSFMFTLFLKKADNRFVPVFDIARL